MQEAYLRFWGVRGSYAVPAATHLRVGGNTSCVEIRSGDHILICDAGTGIIGLGDKLLGEARRLPLMVLFTHYHWDHICGLPFFQPTFKSGWDIQFFGPGPNGAEMKKRLSSQMKSPYFPVETESWIADISYLEPRGPCLDHGPIRITYQHVHHPGLTYGYRMEVAGKSIAYVPDHEYLFQARSLESRAQEFSAADREYLAHIEREERTSETALIRGVDVLIHDAQYTPKQYAEKRGWGHSCFIDAVNLAIDTEVKALYLYHHDPASADADMDEIHAQSLKIIAARGSALQCYVAQEGMTLNLSEI